MDKILVSWVAFNNDFIKDSVNVNGPNYIIHKDFYDNYKKHIILSSAVGDDNRAIRLENKLKLDFPKHNIEIRYMAISDIIDLDEVKSKTEKLLLDLKDNEIDIFFSPGTSIMQLSWYICHTTLKLNTRLIQVRPADKSETGKPEWIEIETTPSSIPVSAIIKQKSLESDSLYNKMDHFLLTESLKPVYDRAFKIAKTDVTTLIFGASGTGKEHLAKFIHQNSIRKNQIFIPVNCSAMNDQLLESRLFGYKKGAFTGAEKDTKGIFEEANKGTVFLDEIGDISTYMQQSLLRVLQEKEIQPIGGKPALIDVRIISATNKDIRKLCEEGKFRWDLFYRLMVADLELPLLLERGKKEIEELINFFLQEKQILFNREQSILLTKEAKDFLTSYSFPGNVRELENIIETIYVFCDDKATLDDIPKRLKETTQQGSLKWMDVEKNHIIKVLELKGGNQRQACLTLGYKSINTLKKKIKDYDINI